MSDRLPSPQTWLPPVDPAAAAAAVEPAVRYPVVVRAAPGVWLYPAMICVFGAVCVAYPVENLTRQQAMALGAALLLSGAAWLWILSLYRTVITEDGVEQYGPFLRCRFDRAEVASCRRSLPKGGAPGAWVIKPKRRRPPLRMRLVDIRGTWLERLGGNRL